MKSMRKSDLQSSSSSEETGAKGSTVVAEPVGQDGTSAPASRAEQAEAARTKASQFMANRQFAEARKALEEADALDAPVVETSKSGPRNVLAALRWRLSRKSDSADKSDATPEAPEQAVVLTSIGTVDEGVRIVNLYSKIAAAAGLLPGNLLNFAAILAIQVTMVWRIANTFGHKDGKNRVRGSILALMGSVLPTSVGHGIGFVVASIPAIIAGSVLYFLVTPVLAYALTQAVGNTFVMHFESGGTLLDFDPKAFQEYFLKEFREAGGTLKTATA
jgi:uncharacterized protein (DUF697 family)